MNSSMIIRVLGTATGIGFIIISGLMIYIGQDSLASHLTGVFLGAIFIVYGVGGNKALSKVLPGMAKTKIGK